jgi:hypothetical protein
VFARAFLQQVGNGRLRIEEQMLRSELERRGIPVELYTIKRIQRRNLPLSQEVFIAGDMDAMHGAMSQLGIEVPLPDDYPDSLGSFLHRRVWKESLGDVWHRVASEAGPPVFAKPATRRKSFTGRVFESPGDFAHVGAVSRSQEVWCSEIVAWQAEHRVYVIDGDVAGIDFYAGDRGVDLDLATVRSALRAYGDSGRAPCAYGIDFGVLASGETALVEANDGYALGAYGIEARPYAELVLRRWHELLSTSRDDKPSALD